MGMKVMAVVDKAPFHTVKLVQEKRPVWYVRGPVFYCLLRTTPLEFHSGCGTDSKASSCQGASTTPRPI